MEPYLEHEITEVEYRAQPVELRLVKMSPRSVSVYENSKREE